MDEGFGNETDGLGGEGLDTAEFDSISDAADFDPGISGDGDDFSAVAADSVSQSELDAVAAEIEEPPVELGPAVPDITAGEVTQAYHDWEDNIQLQIAQGAKELENKYHEQTDLPVNEPFRTEAAEDFYKWQESDQGLIESEVADVEPVSDWVSDVNVNYDPFDINSPYNNNCGECAEFVYNKLEGKETTEVGTGTLTIEQMEEVTGVPQVEMTTDEIKQNLIDQGPGSHGVVGIDRVDMPGHWFNACYDGNEVYMVDGQSGEYTPWPPTDLGNVSKMDFSAKGIMEE